MLLTVWLRRSALPPDRSYRHLWCTLAFTSLVPALMHWPWPVHRESAHRRASSLACSWTACLPSYVFSSKTCCRAALRGPPQLDSRVGKRYIAGIIGLFDLASLFVKISALTSVWSFAVHEANTMRLAVFL
eukprot:3230473-Pleurochrysis_carterae.AAC.1